MKNNIVNQIRENLIEIIPELAEEDISNDSSLRDLGANSVDRGELITLTLEHLGEGDAIFLNGGFFPRVETP